MRQCHEKNAEESDGMQAGRSGDAGETTSADVERDRIGIWITVEGTLVGTDVSALALEDH